MRFKVFCFSCLLVWNCLNSFAQERFNADVDQQGEEILSKMTVDEKLSYIGGIDWMYTKNINRLGISRMKMTDGPHLTSLIVVGYIKGVQDQGVMATVKHFVANNSESVIRNHFNRKTLIIDHKF
jgi:hypothetical protein